MAITFKELKQYISRVVRISVCFIDGHYENYTLVSDIPDGKYDNLYIYGIGMIDVEFPRDVYAKPQRENTKTVSLKDDFMGCGLEIVVQEEPRDDIERHDNQRLCFGDLRNYLQIGRNFSVVRREDWSSEEYEWRKDIPEEYDSLYVYGIGLEDNRREVINPQYENIRDSYLTKQMVIVLSEEARKDIKNDIFE